METLETPSFKNLNTLLIAGTSKTYDMSCDEFIGGIPKQWKVTVPLIENLPDKVGLYDYGIVYKSTAQTSIFEYVVGTEVSRFDINHSNLKEIKIPAQLYAIFTHKYHVSKLKDTIQAILEEWLPQSEYKPTNFPHFLERYSSNFNPETGMGGLEIMLPVCIKNGIE